MASKRHYLLLEILIALTLMGTLLSFLFSFMVQTLRIDKKMEAARELVLERQALQIRMQDLLTSLISKDSTPALYSQKFPKEVYESLIVCFDYGIDPNPLFSGVVTGRIYVDEEQRLCLVCWPTEEDQKENFRKEVLLSNISDLSIQFLGEMDPPQIRKHKTLWQTSWPKDKKEIPSILRMTFKQKGKVFKFAFRLPCANPIPTYISVHDKPVCGSFFA